MMILDSDDKAREHEHVLALYARRDVDMCVRLTALLLSASWD